MIKGTEATITYEAFNTADNAAETGDVAHHAIRVIKDGVSAAATNTPTEVDATNDPGMYKLVLTAAEMTASTIRISGKSSTDDVIIIGPFITTENGQLDAISTAIAAVPTAAEIDTELTSTHGDGSWLTAGLTGIPAAVWTHDIDSTGSPLTAAKAMEAVVASATGKASLDGGVWTVLGHDGSTTVLSITIAGTNRTASTIS